MDCQTALEILDCVRPKSSDLELPEFEEARAHLTECESCRVEFDRRQQFDTEVSRVVADVAVPDSLRMSLLAAMHGSVAEFAAAEPALQPASVATAARMPQAPAAVRSRRRVNLVVSLSVCLAIAALSAWFWQPGLPLLSLAKIQSELNLTLSDAEFDNGFSFSLPSSWASNPGLRVSEKLSGLDLDDRSGHDAAGAYFAFAAGRAAPIRGVLVALPTARISDIPTATVFARAPVAYPQKGIVATAWHEGDLVYVCFVSGSAAQLEWVQHGMTGSAA
ncbi:hypothetical protein GC176_06925 [bacterium]|nr:hypothetical protein [bacterium]